MAAEIFLRIRAPDPRVVDDPVAAKSTNVIQRSPAIAGVTLEEACKPLGQFLDHVGTDRVIEHGGGADLDRAAAEQKIIQRVGEFANAADSGKLSIWKRLRHLRNLGERLGQD